MDLPLRQLPGHLGRKLAPLYVIHGDEPLLAIEAGDAIRAAARRAGFTEREVLVADPSFQWDAFLAANANRGLFGERKVVDLRLPSGKPGVEGASALEACAGRQGDDQMLLVTLPKIDRATQSSAWFAALAAAGVVIAVYPLERDELPRWIAERLALQKQRVGPETLAYLAERCEGNLFAARQEIEKLGLLLAQGELDEEAVVQAVTDVSRFDAAHLSEAWLGGDAARTVKIIAALQAEGEALPLLLWQLGEDLRALAAVQDAVAAGMSHESALRGARVWGIRRPALERAARRVNRPSIPRMLRALANLDALSKGIGHGNAWDDLATLGLALAGTPALPPTV